MDEQISLQPSILPPLETPEIHGPVAERVLAEDKHSVVDMLKKFAPYIGIFCILLVILVVSSVSKTTTLTGPTTIATPTPTSEVKVISSKSLNYFATESAFIKFDATIESLPKVIQEAVLQDPRALPPVLDLPLGFSN